MSSKSSLIEVRDGHLGKAVHACRRLDRGQLILTAWGPLISHRTRHSIQVSHDEHVVVGTTMELLNHSCDPNCGFLIRRDAEVIELYPLRTIEPGEEMTIDYATFEDEIQHMDGSCLCGSSICRGKITGYHALSIDRRLALADFIAPHLREYEPAAETGAA